jgi:type II secretory pathway component PulF
MAADTERTALGLVKFVAWRVVTAVVITLIIVTLWFGVTPLLALASPFLILMFFPEMAGMSTRVRRQRAAVILSYLEQAVRLNLPLPGMLAAARQSEKGRTALQLSRVQTLLEQGASLETALRLETPEVSPRIVSLIGSAERMGQLPQALARIMEEERETPDDAERSAFGRWYPLMMTLVLLGVGSLIMVFVMPKMEEIFKDFGLRLPPITRSLLSVSRMLFQGDIGDIPVVLIGVVVVWVITLGGMFERIWTQPQELPRPTWVDYIAWVIPVWHGVARDRGLGDACDTIAAALRSGRPLHRAIEEATTIRMNEVLRERLREWQLGVEAGQAADEAARQAQLPDLVCGMIGAGRGAEPAEAVEFLASYYHGRFSRSRELLRAGAVPIMALVFGGFVLFVAAGMFSPLVEMMDHLTTSAMKVSK